MHDFLMMNFSHKDSRTASFTKIYFVFLCVIVSSWQKVGAQNQDFKILQSINAREMPNWDKTMKGVSFSVYPVMPLTCAGIWSHGYFTKDPVMMRNGYKSAITIGLALGITTGLKLAINRPRPYVTYPDEIIKRDETGNLSFPSGHTTGAFATATAISLTYKKWYVVAPAYMYAGLVGYSRMRLGVHYPTDVLGGMVVGIGCGFLTWGIDKLIQGK